LDGVGKERWWVGVVCGKQRVGVELDVSTVLRGRDGSSKKQMTKKEEEEARGRRELWEEGAFDAL